MAPNPAGPTQGKMAEKTPDLEENQEDEENEEADVETEANEEEEEPPSHLPFAPPSSSEVISV
jgi:hypothetical protein